jgi:hypothetical protein
MNDQQPRAAGKDSQGKGSGLGGLWILLAPLACCGGPLIIGGLAAAGALAWGGLGLGIALAVAVAAVLVMRRRRATRACCPPEAADSSAAASTGSRPAVTADGRFPAR